MRHKIKTHLKIIVKKAITISFLLAFGVVATKSSSISEKELILKKVYASDYVDKSVIVEQDEKNLIKQSNTNENEKVFDTAEFIINFYNKYGQKVSLEEIDIKNSIGEKDFELKDDGIHIIEELNYEQIANTDEYRYSISKTNEEKWIYASNIVINPNDFLNITIKHINTQLDNSLYALSTQQDKDNQIVNEQKTFSIENMFNFNFKNEYIANIKLNNISIENKYAIYNQQPEIIEDSKEFIDEENVEKENVYTDNFFSIYDIFGSSEYIKPIEEDKIIEYLYDEEQAVGILSLKVKEVAPICAMANEATLLSYKNNIAKIKYSNCIMTIENIILNQNMVDVLNDDRIVQFNMGDIIGNSLGEIVNIFIEKNEKLLNLNFIYSQYEYPTKTIALPILLQTDPQWADYTYGCSKIGPSGCGPTSFAMVLSGFYGYEYRVDNLSDEMYAVENDYGWYYLDGAGSYFAMFQKLADMYGINMVDKINCQKDNLISLLEDGNVIILGIKESPYYESGHFIVVTGTENGKFYINDSYGLFKKDTLYDYSFFGTINRGYAFKY